MSTIISRLQERINREIRELNRLRSQLQEKLDLIDNLSDDMKTLLSNSASSAQARRNKRTLSLEEAIEQYERQVDDIKQAIEERQATIDAYEEEKADMIAKYES